MLCMGLHFEGGGLQCWNRATHLGHLVGTLDVSLGAHESCCFATKRQNIRTRSHGPNTAVNCTSSQLKQCRPNVTHHRPVPNQIKHSCSSQYKKEIYITFSVTCKVSFCDRKLSLRLTVHAHLSRTALALLN